MDNIFKQQKRKRKRLIWLLVLVFTAILFTTTTAFAEGEEPVDNVALEEVAPEEEGSGEVDSTSSEVMPEEAEVGSSEEGESENDDETGMDSEEEDVEANSDEDSTSEEITADDLPGEEDAGPIDSEEFDEINADEDEPILVDTTGEPLDKASVESEELLRTGDPYFMYRGDKYAFVDNIAKCPGDAFSCIVDGNPIGAALQYMTDNSMMPSDGYLYVEGDTYPGFTVDGSSSTEMAMLRGVIGVDGSENTFITGDISVLNNTGGFLLQGFTLETGGAIYFDGNSGTAKLVDIQVDYSDEEAAITVINQSGPVEMELVQTKNNDKKGTLIDVTPGTYSVTVTNSAFLQNGWAYPGYGSTYSGLTVRTLGKVTLNGITSCNNNGDGLTIGAGYSSLTVKDAFLQSNSTSNMDNWGYALWAGGTNGLTNLENVHAYDNDYGIEVEGGTLRAKNIEVNLSHYSSGLYFYNSTGSATIEYASFQQNSNNGLYIDIAGPIRLSSINAAQNISAGAFLDTRSGSGSIYISSRNSDGFYGANYFGENSINGLTIYSAGSVYIANANFMNNTSYGLKIDNTDGKSNVTVTTTLKYWTNEFSENGFSGADVQSNGTVEFSQAVFRENENNGLTIVGEGNIVLKNVVSYSNLGFGGYLENSTAARPRNVMITDSRFNHNHYSGLYIYCNGNVIANGLSANGNSLRQLDVTSYPTASAYYDLLGGEWIQDTFTFDGTLGDTIDLDLVSIDFDGYLHLYAPDGSLEFEDDDSGTDSNAWIHTTLAQTGTYTVVVSSVDGVGYYTFSINDHSGTITSPNTYSRTGALIKNDYGTGSVTIRKPKNTDYLNGNDFNLNSEYGLQIVTNGTVYIDSASANMNYWQGLVLDNAGSRGAVSILNTRKDYDSCFDENGSFGIYARTRGTITLRNLSATYNKSTGVYLDNCVDVGGVCQGFGGVYVLADSSRQNYFNGNTYYGLYVLSFGAIQMVNTEASDNNLEGVYLDNDQNLATGYVKIFVKGRDMWNVMENNGNSGLRITSNGLISIANTYCGSNGDMGIYARNSSSTRNIGMNLKYVYAGSNTTTGVDLRSNGNVLWSYGGAWDNKRYGAWIYNSYGWPSSITVGGSSKEPMMFEYNGDSGSGYHGLFLNSEGKITIKYTNASYNSGCGFNISNNAGITLQPVYITAVEAEGNDENGLNVATNGSILIKGINCRQNGDYGANLSNNYSSGPGHVTISTLGRWTSNNFDGNGDHGLWIIATGNVTLSNINANENDGNGIYISNAGYGYSVTLNSSGDYFALNSNTGSGLYIYSAGRVTLNNKYGLYANNNQGSNGGVYIDNTGSAKKDGVKVYKLEANENENGGGLVVNSTGDFYGNWLTMLRNQSNGAFIHAPTGKVTFTGRNRMSENTNDGLYINAEGNVTIDYIETFTNGNDGIQANSTNGKISIRFAETAHNQENGLRLIGNGDFYLYKVSAFLNGQSNPSDSSDNGLYISAGSALSNITILYGTFMANWWGNGIEIDHPSPVTLQDDSIAPYLRITKTYYMGNGDTNLYIH